MRGLAPLATVDIDFETFYIPEAASPFAKR